MKHSNWSIKLRNADNKTLDDNNNNNSDFCFAKSIKYFVFKLENFNVSITIFCLQLIGALNALLSI